MRIGLSFGAKRLERAAVHQKRFSGGGAGRSQTPFDFVHPRIICGMTSRLVFISAAQQSLCSFNI